MSILLIHINIHFDKNSSKIKHITYRLRIKRNISCCMIETLLRCYYFENTKLSLIGQLFIAPKAQLTYGHLQ